MIGFAERRAGKPEAATLSEFAHTLRVGLGFREQPLVGSRRRGQTRSAFRTKSDPIAPWLIRGDQPYLEIRGIA